MSPDPPKALATGAPMPAPSAPPHPRQGWIAARRLWQGTLHFPQAAVEHWTLTVPLVLTTAALMAFVDQPASADIANYDGEHDSKALSNDLLLIAEPAESVADGFLLRRDRPLWPTLRMEAVTVLYASAAVLAMKAAAGRERPYTPNDGDGGFFQGGSSFPSGHAMASFTIAAFLAHRYPRHAWVAWLGYGLAVAVSVLRFTAKEHFPSDLFAGGVFGYLVGRCAITCQ